MNMEASVKTFLGAIVVGMGFHIGWGLIAILFELGAQAVGHHGFLK